MECTIDNTKIIFGDKKDHNLKHYDPYDVDNIRGVLPSLAELRKKDKGLTKGVVRTILDGKIVEEDGFAIVDKNGNPKSSNCGLNENIVVARGRRFVAQRLFGTKHPSDLQVYDWEISHFGLGKGGAVIIGSTVNLVGPELCDQDLYDPVKLTGNPPDPLFLQSPGDNIRGVDPTDHVVKPIEPSGMVDIILTQDIQCDFGPTFSYVRCVCVKSIQEPNYLPEDDDYILINESCLYYSNGNDAYAFAHICFPPKYVEKKSEFVVEWYILC